MPVEFLSSVVAQQGAVVVVVVVVVAAVVAETEGADGQNNLGECLPLNPVLKTEV